MMEPFLPFSKLIIEEPTITAVTNVLRSGWITSGPKVQEFEEVLSHYFDGRIVRVFNSGTCTIEIALHIAHIGIGDEVITTPISWVATANVIIKTGARPVFVDVDPITRNIDLNKIEAAITPRTKGIIPVYLSGLPVDMDRLYTISEKYNLHVIEDAAQALGSTWKGKRIGAFGNLVSFSFQANKNITTAEGGCLVLNNKKQASLAEKYRLQGITRSGFDNFDVDVLGGKFNMTDIAAAMGLSQFSQINAITKKRRSLAKHYFNLFEADFENKFGAQLPIADFENTNWHMYQLVLPNHFNRATFIEKMMKYKIGIGYHYPAIHLLKLYRELGFKKGTLPIAEHIGQQIVSLPIFTTMRTEDVERVVTAVKSVLA